MTPRPTLLCILLDPQAQVLDPPVPSDRNRLELQYSCRSPPGPVTPASLAGAPRVNILGLSLDRLSRLQITQDQIVNQLSGLGWCASDSLPPVSVETPSVVACQTSRHVVADKFAGNVVTRGGRLEKRYRPTQWRLPQCGSPSASGLTPQSLINASRRVGAWTLDLAGKDPSIRHRKKELEHQIEHGSTQDELTISVI